MDAEKPVVRPRLVPSTRFLIALLVCFGFVIQYAQRLNLSIGIICMVNKTKINFELEQTTKIIQETDISEETDIIESTTTTIERATFFFKEQQFFWNEFDQQIVLGSYWIGYLFTLVPSGWLSMTLGAKLMYATAVFISSLATIALSSVYFLQNASFFLIVCLRILIGAAHGALFPVTYTLWAQWAVPNERGTLSALSFCGTNLGTSFIVLIGGILCRYVNSGWMHTILLSGILGFIWLPLWMWQVADTPGKHHSISNNEREYIENIIGKNHQNKTRRPISISSLPWKKIIRSKPVIGLFITQLCNLFGLFFFLSNLGKLLTEIHRIPNQYTGFILACGYMFMLLGNLSSGIIADKLVQKNIISMTIARKIFNSLASFIPCLCMISFCFCDENQQVLGVITVLLLLLSSGFAYGSGYMVNFNDLVPAYSALIFAIGTTVSSLNAIIGNIIAGIIIKQPTLYHWRKLFIIFAILYLIGGIVFIIYGSSVAEKWATFEAQEQAQTGVQSKEETLLMEEQQQQNDELKTKKDNKTDQNTYVNA